MKIKHQGLHAHRLKTNVGEARFAAAWETVNEREQLLDYLLHTGSQGGTPPPEAEGRDRVVAATVVQWLGSAVGENFLRDLGYERAPVKR